MKQVLLFLALCVAILGLYRLEMPQSAADLNPQSYKSSQDVAQAKAEDLSPGAQASSLQQENANSQTSAMPQVADQETPLPNAAQDAESSEVAQAIVSQCIEIAQNLPSEQKQTKPSDDSVISGSVQRGATLGQLLAEGSEGNVAHFVSAARKVFPLRSLREGQPYLLTCDPDTGHLSSFEYEIDAHRRLVVEEIAPNQAEARIEAIVYDTRLVRADGKITDNLFQAVSDAGESAQLALKLAELFGSEINFIRDLQPGDSFSVLLEKRSRDGEDKGYGRVLAARFVNRGKSYEAFLYRGQDGRLAHYNRKGENLRKTLLQAPLAFTRLSSRFSMGRLHPILGERRPHLGVDYAAPKGTPVKAVGDGIIRQRGWAGGYGNQVVISHNAALESLYGHLSGFAKGLGPGSRVRQGQVIGYVGSTGLSSGPHLDFRLRQNGRFVNPQKAINPRSAPIPRQSMANFERHANLSLDWLEGRRSLDGYDAAAFLPEPEKTSVGMSTEQVQEHKGAGRRNSARARNKIKQGSEEQRS